MPKQLVTIQDLVKIKIVGDPQIAPDGKRIIYTVHFADPEKNKYWTHLWLATVKDRAARQFSFGQVSDSSPRWSHDGKTIAFFRTKEKQTQVWLVPADGGEPRALSELPEGSLGDLSWSPDDRVLSFGFRPSHPDWTQEAAKKRGENGASNPARVVKRARYRLDGSGFQDERQHVWVCEITTGKATQLTRGEYDDSRPVWSPDCKSLAFVSNRSADADRQSYRDDIWIVSAHGGKPVRVATPAGEKTALAFSPDGRWIAYIGTQVGQDPWRPKNDRLWIVSKRGGNVRGLGLELDRTVGNATLGDTRELAATVPLWSPDGKRIFVIASDAGSCHLYAAEVTSGRLTPVTQGPIDVSGVSMDAAGRSLALLVADPTHPAEVYFASASSRKLDLTQLSDANGQWRRQVKLSEPEEFWITQPDGTRVQGWIIRPPNASRTRKLPLLLYVHGGPHSQYGNVFFHELQLHAARGYVVVYSNPRGSMGREEEYAACIHRDWGHLDYDDVLAVADYAAALPYVWADENWL